MPILVEQQLPAKQIQRSNCLIEYVTVSMTLKDIGLFHFCCTLFFKVLLSEILYLKVE